MYPLTLTKSREVSRHTVGAYQVVILTDCESAGFIQYTHVAMVYSQNKPLPVYAVATETSPYLMRDNKKSHFLCVYADKQENHGNSNDWADLEKFTQEVLRLVANRVPAPAQLDTERIKRLQSAIEKEELQLKQLDPKAEPDQYATALLNLGSAWHDLSRKVTDKVEPLQRARDVFQEGLKHLKAETDLDEYISAYVLLTQIYFDLARAQNTPVAWIKARDIHQEAISAALSYQITTQDLLLGETYERLGDIFKLLGDPSASQALTAWNSAKQAYQRANFPQFAQSVTYKIETVDFNPAKRSISQLSQPPSKSLLRRTFDTKSATPNTPASPPSPARTEPTKTSSAISQEFLKLLVNNTISVKTIDPTFVTDWQSDLVKFQQQLADAKPERAFIDALLAVTQGHSASLPAGNPYQTLLARVIGTIAGFHLTPEAKTGGTSGQAPINQDTFTRLFLEASDLPASLKQHEDHRREKLQPRDVPFEECGGLHSGLTVWMGQMTEPLWRLVDIRWSFPSQEAAYAYHHRALLVNCEGQQGAVGCQPVGTDGFVFGGKTREPVFGMEMTQFFYLFRVQRTVVKLYVAEGDRLAPGQALTSSMIEPIAEKIVSRILSVDP